VSELISEDDFPLVVPANDIDKDTMQLQIINDDIMSASQGFFAESIVSKQGFDHFGSQVLNVGKDYPISAKGSTVGLGLAARFEQVDIKENKNAA